MMSGMQRPRIARATTLVAALALATIATIATWGEPQAMAAAPSTALSLSQDDTASLSRAEPVEELRQRVAKLKALEAPTPEDKTRIDQLQEAIDTIGRAQASRQKTIEFRDAVAQLPQRLETARTPVPPPPSLPAGATLEQLEQASKVASADVAAAREAIAQSDTQLAQLAERRRTLPDAMARARTALAEAVQAAKIIPAPAPGAPDSVRQLALARADEQQSLVPLLDAELASLDARGQVLTAQRDAAQKRVDAAEGIAKALRSQLDDHRRALAEAAETSARETTAKGADAPKTTDPRIAAAAAENLEVAKALRKAGQQLNDISDEARLLDEEVARIERDHLADQERARLAGTSDELSIVLRRRQQALPTLRTLEQATARNHAARLRIDLARINGSAQLDRLNAELRRVSDATDEGELEKILEERREKLLLPLLRTLDDVSTKLAAMEATELRLADLVTAYRVFIAERILWARSGTPVWEFAGQSLIPGSIWLWSQVTTAESWRAVWLQIEFTPFPALIGLVLAVILLLVRPFLRAWLVRLAEEVSRGSNDRFVLTLEALIATVLMAMAVPIAMVGIGLSLASNEVGGPLGVAISVTMTRGAVWVGILLFTYRLVRRQGLASDHFGWRRDQLDLLQHAARNLFWLSTPCLLAGMLIRSLADEEVFGVPFDASLTSEGRDHRTVGYFAFAPFIVILIWAAWRLFRPRSGLMAAHITQNPGGWVSRLRVLWFGAILAAPTSTLVLLLLGWGYTATVLTNRLVASAALALIVVVVEAVLLRALEFAARSFANQWRERLLERETPMPGTDAAQKQEVRTEVAALSRKSRSAIKGLSMIVLFGGLIYIWSDLLPALRAFDTVSPWDGANGPVTLGHIIWAIMIAVLAGFAAKNLPGAVEVLVLQHTGASSAARYAASAVMGYGIVIFGVVATASFLGLSWQSVQWLVAAIGVGLGFGLQEIVGNFVAGLIVLFEQPVRVGDVVTVGDRTGQIMRIRIRATTIRDLDGKDLILPNKMLITDRVVNWTLSNAPLRLVVPVGVAYGTDLALAESLLLESSKSLPTVLSRPAPLAQLMGFGGSSIDFEVRVHVARVEQLLPARHALMKKIQESFNQAGVVIAFPQMDVHIDPAAIERMMKEIAR